MRILRSVGLAALLGGGAGSLALMLKVGERNPSRALMVLFAIWVLAPYVALALLDRRASKRAWPPRARTALQVVTPAIALGPVAIYASVAFGLPRPQPAAWFLLTPLASMALIGAVAASGELAARRAKA